MKPSSLFQLLSCFVFFFGSFFVFASSVSAQGTQSCCSTASGDFAMMADDPSFLAAHLAPVPFVKDPGPGMMITFKTKDETPGNAFEVKAPAPTKKVLLVFHEWWGLNDYIKREAESLQKELGDVTVYAIDLYDGKVADSAKDAQAYASGMNEERGRAIIAGAIAMVGKKASIATLGWCFGGGWSLQASLMAGKQAAACVMYYGMPEKSVEKLKTLHTDVLGIFGTKDAFITPEVVATFKKNMKEAGKKLEVKTYDAVHAFANPSNPKYDKDAAADAHAAAMEFLKNHFGEKKS